MAIQITLLILMLAAPAVYGEQHIVGGSAGWGTKLTARGYAAWSAIQPFLVGDTLLFNYNSSHKVDVVSQTDYNNCSSANPISSHSDGATTITLSNAGFIYFICPTAGHCVGGMKLAVNVTATPPTITPATPPPPSTTQTPPTPPSTPSTTTPSTTISPPPPPPPPSGAASICSSMNNLMFGFSVVIGTMFAFMG